jgi:pyruvate-formate lyase-activating enzyme
LGKIVIRTPVIPGTTATREHPRGGAFIRDALGGNIVQYQLLPFRKMVLKSTILLELPIR